MASVPRKQGHVFLPLGTKLAILRLEARRRYSDFTASYKTYSRFSCNKTF